MPGYADSTVSFGESGKLPALRVCQDAATCWITEVNEIDYDGVKSYCAIALASNKHGVCLITRRAEFDGLRPWVSTSSRRE